MNTLLILHNFDGRGGGRRKIRAEREGRKIKSVNVIAHINALDFPL
jgi:hypothetical protein